MSSGRRLYLGRLAQGPSLPPPPSAPRRSALPALPAHLFARLTVRFPSLPLIHRTDATRREVEDFFPSSKYGPLVDVRLMNGFGFVEFESSKVGPPPRSRSLALALVPSASSSLGAHTFETCRMPTTLSPTRTERSSCE